MLSVFACSFVCLPSERALRRRAFLRAIHAMTTATRAVGLCPGRIDTSVVPRRAEHRRAVGLCPGRIDTVPAHFNGVSGGRIAKNDYERSKSWNCFDPMVR